MRSNDVDTRDLVTSRPGAGWDFALTRHPFFEHERPLGPHYSVYNRRLMVANFDHRDIEDGYWKYRREVGLQHTGEYVLQFKGPDAERLMDLLFTRDVTKVKIGRCGYGLACYDDGGLIVDGILMRLEEQRFWYVQADGDFYSWARAHAGGMDVDISDPDVFVSQVQGPNSLKLLEAAARGGVPDDFTFYGIARVDLGGQEIIVTRTGYVNELGWEFYTEPHHDPDRLWAHLQNHGLEFGLDMVPVDASDPRRIEAGILNAGSDFNADTTPFDVGLGRFVDAGKGSFIGKKALLAAPKERRLFGYTCREGSSYVSAQAFGSDEKIGVVTAAAFSPYLRCGVGFVLLDAPSHQPGATIEIQCRDGKTRPAELVDPPFYDKAGDIPRGKVVDVPERTV